MGLRPQLCRSVKASVWVCVCLSVCVCVFMSVFVCMCENECPAITWFHLIRVQGQRGQP